MVVVEDSRGFQIPYARARIVRTLLTETRLAPEIYGIPAMDEETATAVAVQVEEKIAALRVETIATPFVREITNMVLAEMGLLEYRALHARVGMPVYDAWQVDVGEQGNGDNANLQPNAETSHKRKADRISKEEALLLLPPHLRQMHMDGTFHIHDLEYFTSRIFCTDHDLRYFFYYGLMPDGTGNSASVAGPAQRAEVAILHAVKALSVAQTNAAGGQGYYNFLTFLAPYLAGLDYAEIKQLMQMFVYEMTQMMVARGGQSLCGDSLILVKDATTNRIQVVPIGEFCHRYVEADGEARFSDPGLETLSVNRETGELEWKPITGVYVHRPATPLLTTTLSDGRSVTTTSDHSLFTLDASGAIVEVKPGSNPQTILTTERIPYGSTGDFDPELMFFIGVCIGDGNLVDNNGNPLSAIAICPSDATVRDRVERTARRYTGSKFTWREQPGRDVISARIPTEGIPYIKEIGRGAHNKKIPDALLSGSDSTLYVLLDGLFSTDGNVSRDRYEFNTTSEILARQVEFVLMRLGLRYTVSVSDKTSNFVRNHPVWVIRINAQDSQKLTVTNASRQISRRPHIEQQRHNFAVIKGLVKDRLTNPSTHGYAFKSSDRKLKKKDLSGVRDQIPEIWTKVKDIIPMEVRSVTPAPAEEFVYDIGVQDNENFVLHNGLVAHNTVFSSVQLTPGVPKLWKDKPVVMRGLVWDGDQTMHRKLYGEYEKEVRLAFAALMDIMLEGDHWGKPFNFPKPEIGIESQFMVEDEAFNRDHPDLPTYADLYGKAFALAAKFGTPYFDNMLPAYRRADGDGISCYQCLPGDTPIWILRNNEPMLIPIAALDGSDRVLTPDRGYQPFESILAEQYDGALLFFFLGSGRTFCCTPTHSIPVRCMDAEMSKAATDVVETDRIAFITDDGPVWDQILGIHRIPYHGKVYDPVNVPGHKFVLGNGIVTGNCCAYQFGADANTDQDFDAKLSFRDGKHFSMGSYQVVTLNLPRVAYQSASVDEFITRAQRLMDAACEVFVIKKRWMDRIRAAGRAPFLTQRPADPHTHDPGAMLVDFDSLVYTIGVIGINEVVWHLTGHQLHESPAAVKAALKIMLLLKQYSARIAQTHGIEIAFARTPAETTGQRFAIADLLLPEYRAVAARYVQGDVETALREIDRSLDLPVYYTNGTHVPPGAPVTIATRIGIEERFFPLVDGGNILHIWIGEEHPDPVGLQELVLRICRTTNVGYFAITRDLTVCRSSYRPVNP